MLIPLISVGILILGYYVGRICRFYILFYNNFLESYEEISRYHSMYHPECFDENGNLFEDEEYLYINSIEEDFE